jgi:fructokinase
VLFVAGEALVDLVIDPAGRVTAALGGAPFNTARACGRLGTDVGFVGAISIDRFGSMSCASLEDARVDTEHVVRVDLPTTLAAAELDPGGAATYRFYIEGTAAPALTRVPDRTPDVLFTGGLGLVLEPMADTIESLVSRTAGAGGSADDRPMVVVDVNCRPLVVPDRDRYVQRVGRVLAGADVVKVSDEDLAYLAPGEDPTAAARSLLARGPRAVLMTAGGDATRILTADGEAQVPVRRVDVVDTIGAGDSFGAGFLTWWIASGATADRAGELAHLVPAVEAANAVAAIVCTRRGADSPWRDELADAWWP